MSNAYRHTCIVLNWNTPALTVAAVRSVQRSGPDPEALRFIVIDNGSTDGSVETLRALLPEAELIALPENRGFARAVNHGLRLVSEPFAFILNSDVEFRNDAVTILVEALRADAKAVLACPKLLRPDDSVQAAAVPEPALFWELVNRSLPRHWLRLSDTQPTSVPGIVGPCMAVHMERLEKVGLLDERFFFFFEETDWCKRARDQGLSVLYVPSAHVVHLQGESANRRPYRARIQFYDSRYRYFRKHHGAAASLILFAGLWLRLTLDLLYYTILTVFTLGRPKFRDKLALDAALWCWHLLGCRPAWGFGR